jgi:hypothetical protein
MIHVNTLRGYRAAKSRLGQSCGSRCVHVRRLDRYEVPSAGYGARAWRMPMPRSGLPVHGDLDPITASLPAERDLHLRRAAVQTLTAISSTNSIACGTPVRLFQPNRIVEGSLPPSVTGPISCGCCRHSRCVRYERSPTAVQLRARLWLRCAPQVGHGPHERDSTRSGDVPEHRPRAATLALRRASRRVGAGARGNVAWPARLPLLHIQGGRSRSAVRLSCRNRISRLRLGSYLVRDDDHRRERVGREMP